MNKPEFSFVLGVMITLINSIALTCNIFTFINQFKKVISKELKKEAINYHFIFLLTVFPFTFGNGLALARFLQSWVISEVQISAYLSINGFSDRIFMCITSLMFLVLSLSKIPFLIVDDRE